MYQLIVGTDGACKGNPGPGGWCGIMQYNGQEKIVCGFSAKTTNNEMELTALIAVMRSLKKPCNIHVKLDSRFVCTGIANCAEWQKNGWKNKSGKAPCHLGLWKEYVELKNKLGHVVHYQYVKGHSGDELNERCDRIAKEQIDIYLKGVV